MNAAARLCAALLALLPALAGAGALYGTVRLGGAPLGAARILLACPGFAAVQTAADAASDASGSFALRVAANGRCEMRVRRGNDTGPPFAVYLSNNPIRYDFVVDQQLQRVR